MQTFLHGLVLVSALGLTVALASRGQAQENAPVLRVLTYNIHHGEGTDGRFDYDRLATIIRRLEPDVVAVQEVDRGTRRADGVDQAERLAALTGMGAVFGNALYYSGGEYGEAILSRFPLDHVRAHHLPFRFGQEPRTALEVTVTPDNGLPPFVFVGTHLCHQSGETRLDQVKELNRIVSGQAGPVILAGDFNARPGSDPMAFLAERGWLDAVAPRSRIDYVLVRQSDPWRVKSVEIPDEPVASDHMPVLVVLAWHGDQ